MPTGEQVVDVPLSSHLGHDTDVEDGQEAWRFRGITRPTSSPSGV